MAIRYERDNAFLSFLQPGASLQEAALVYASLRIAVFPLLPLKKQPATPHGWHDATTDPERIKAWWSKDPSYNIGIALRPSYIVVIDVDPRNNGDETLKDLIARHGKLPTTYAVRTGNEGVHIYYRVPADFYDTAETWPAKLGSGVDLLVNRYVVAPPSSLPDKRYYMMSAGTLEEDFATLPFGWLRSIINDQQLHKYDSLWTPEDEEWYVPKGERDNTLTSIAGWARAKGAKVEEIEAILRVFIERFEDPGEKLEAISRVAHSVARYRPGDIRFSDLRLTLKTRRKEPELDPLALYGPIGRWVRRIEPITEAHPAALLSQGIAAFGSMISARKTGDVAPGFYVEGSWHRTALYVNVVGDSAKAAKGDSWARVKELFQSIDPTWRSVSGVQTGEGLIDLLADDQPQDQHTVINGVKVQHVRKGSRRDRRCLIIEPEFGRTLHAAERRGSTLKDIYRDLWDHGSTEKITAGSKQSVTDAAVSLIAHITKPELERDTDQVDLMSGFLNRFLHIYTKRTKNLPSARSISDRERLSLAYPLKIALDFAQNDAPVDYEFSDEAWELWEDLCYQFAKPHPSPLIDALTARARPIVRRIAVIFAVADCDEMIHYEQLEAAAALWNYCIETTEYVFGSRLGNRDADRLFRSLIEHRAGLTASEISRDVFRGKRSKEQINRVFATLIDRGLMGKRKEKRGPKTVDIYFVPPDV